MIVGIVIIVITFLLLLIVLNCYIDAIQEDFDKEVGLKFFLQRRHSYKHS
jgi:hypothetical protein